MEKQKSMYLSPRIEAIELENEATVMTGSVVGMPDNTWAPKTSTQNTYSGASNSDLEDMINDILTIEN